MKNYKVFIKIIVLTLFLIIITTGIIKIKEDKLTGKAISTVNITGKQEEYCNITLNPNWNLISFYCLKGNWRINSYALDSVDTTLISMFTYEAFDSNDKWKSYNPSLPAWVVQDLGELKGTNGYWVRVNAADNFELNGTPPGNTTTPITPPWTLVGYPTKNITTPADAFITIDGNYSEIWMYNSTDQTWYTYYPSSMSTLNEIRPGYGYWVRVTSNDSLVINS